MDAASQGLVKYETTDTDVSSQRSVWSIHIHASLRTDKLPEVAQQSRIRHKEDFIIAFSPVIAEATALAYKGAPAELQGKLKRVVDVWKDRSIFEVPIQSAIESRIGGESLLRERLLGLTQDCRSRQSPRNR